MQISDYELTERIGAGGMGEVWVAQNVHTKVRYAVKLLPGEVAQDENFVARFFDEGRVMSELNHPNIVCVHHVGHDEKSGRYYLVMDYVEGPVGKPQTLHDVLHAKPEDRVSEAEALKWATQVAAALAHAHERGIVHRDIKPGNILIDQAGNARVTDFGLAKAVGEKFLRAQIHTSMDYSGGRSMSGQNTMAHPNQVETSFSAEPTLKTGGSRNRSSADSLLGTYDYMSPEQRGELPGVVVGPASDVYSFGVMLYRILTGRRPAGMTESPSVLVPGLARTWDALVTKCMKHQPAERFNNGTELLAAITGKHAAPRWWLWLTMALVASGLGYAAYTTIQSQNQTPPVIVVPAPPSLPPPEEPVVQPSEPVPIIITNPPIVPPPLIPVVPVVTLTDVTPTKVASELKFAKVMKLADGQDDATLKEQCQVLDGTARTLFDGKDYAGAKEKYEMLGRLCDQMLASVKPVVPSPVIPSVVPTNTPQETPTAPISRPPQGGKPLNLDLGDGVKMELLWIPPGEFMMGSSGIEKGRSNAEGMKHNVQITQGFWMGKYEVTQAQWQQVMGNNPSNFKQTGPNAPVENVSWNNCQEFLKKLNQRAEIKNQQVQPRLPTEVEWEYACRAGTKMRFNTGDVDAALDVAGWYKMNSSGKTHEVGKKQANAWGLYDMHGNVCEWCEDVYVINNGAKGMDPPASATERVLRGGSWCGNHDVCRSASRFGRVTMDMNSTSGFRVVCGCPPSS